MKKIFKTAAFTLAACALSLTVIAVAACSTTTHEHTYGDAVWTWSEDNSSATASFTCTSNDDTKTVNATVTSEITTEATCTAEGSAVYTATATFNGETYTTSKTVVISAAGHTYALTGWTWADDYSTAAATFTCSECDNTQTVTATVTSETTATCIAAGKITYTATISAENSPTGVEITDTKEADATATGHTYGNAVWEWSDDYTVATATFSCSSCDDTQTVVATVTSEGTGATCTTSGVMTYTATATFNGETYTTSKVVIISADGHNYGDAVWSWADDYSTATATITCSSCGDKQTVTAKVTSETTAATCTTDGKTVYTATATYNGETYTDTKTVTTGKTGHSYNLTAWSWSDDYSTATATLVCSNCDDTKTISANVTSVITAATCTEDGKTVYTATATYNGVTYTDTKTVTTADKTGHSYGNAVWAWANDYSTATATFTCSDCDDTQTVTADVTSKTTATCQAGGTTTYTATVTFGGVEYTDTKEIEASATAHSYDTVSWTWADDHSYATATFTCSVCGDEHDVIVTDGITSVTTDPTCTKPGSIVYTATATFNGETYVGTKTETIAATGHSYTLTSWIWSNDYSSATAVYTCTEGDNTKTVTATVTSTTTATCTEAGTTTYTATVSAEASLTGVEVTDTKTVDTLATGHNLVLTEAKDATCTEEGNSAYYTCSDCGKYYSDSEGTNEIAENSWIISATGHNYDTTNIVWAWADDYSTATATFTCLGCGNEETVDATITSVVTPACTGSGYITYTATVTFDGVEYTATATDTTAATGHNYEVTWTWSSDYSIASITLVCSSCSDTQTVVAKITIETTEATCTEDGKIVYTATATYDGVTYTDEQTVTIDATGHSYSSTNWTWSSDYLMATVTLGCSGCSDTQTVLATVTVVTTDATCTADGKIVYTATATYDGVTYSDTKTVTIAALGHTYGTTLTYDNGYWYKTCTVCEGSLENGKVAVTENYSDYTFLVSDSTSLAAAISANATNIQLTADISITVNDFVGTTFVADNTTAVNMTIDVAGYTLTITTDSSQTIKDTSIKLYGGKSLTITDSAYDSASTTAGLVLNNRDTTSGSKSDSEKSCVYVDKGCSFTLDSIYATSVGCTIYPAGNAAAVNVKNSKVITSGAYVVATNAATVDNYDVVITIDGSYLESTQAWSCVVYINVAGTLNISDSTIVGKMQGVVVRAGTATISNTTITCTMAESDITETMIGYTTTPSTWGSNPNIALGAIVVGNVTSNTYKANAKLTITDCTISYTITEDSDDVDYSEYAIALYLVRLGSTDYTTEVTLTGTNNITGYVINVIGGEDYTSTLTGYSGTVYYYAYDADSLAAALAAGATNIILTADISGDTTYTVASGVTTTLDLNGYTLTSSSSTKISVESGATLTINGSGTITTSSSTNKAIDNLGSLTLNDVTISGSGYGVYTSTSKTAAVALTINGGSISSTANNAIFVKAPKVTIEINNAEIKTTGSLKHAIDNESGTVTINGADTVIYSNTGAAIYSTKSYSSATATLNINNGSITSNSKYAIYVVKGTTINMTGGTVQSNGTATTSYGIWLVSGTSATYKSTLNISGGEVISNGSYGIYVDGGNATYEEVNISGTASIVSNATNSSYCVGVLNKKGVVNVSGGTITAENGVGIYNKASSGNELNISGGTISGNRGIENLFTMTMTGGTVKGKEIGIYIAEGTAGKVTTISGSSVITAESSDEDAWSYGIYLGSGMELSISGDVTISAKNTKTGAAGIFCVGSGDSDAYTTLTVSSGTIYGNTYAISGNGAEHYTSITINGGIIGYNGDNTSVTGIYHPQIGTLTINGGTITGVNSAIEIRSGTLTIADGTFTATSTSFSETENSNGTTIIGAAVAISQHTTDKDITVTILGGTFNGVYALYEKDLETTSTNDGVIKISVSDGTFNGKVEANTTYENVSVLSIAGGTYTTDVSAHVASGYTCSSNGESGYTVTAND